MHRTTTGIGTGRTVEQFDLDAVDIRPLTKSVRDAIAAWEIAYDHPLPPSGVRLARLLRAREALKRIVGPLHEGVTCSGGCVASLDREALSDTIVELHQLCGQSVTADAAEILRAALKSLRAMAGDSDGQADGEWSRPRRVKAWERLLNMPPSTFFRRRKSGEFRTRGTGEIQIRLADLDGYDLPELG